LVDSISDLGSFFKFQISGEIVHLFFQFAQQFTEFFWRQATVFFPFFRDLIKIR